MVKVLYYSEICLLGWKIQVVILDLCALFAEYFSGSLLILHFLFLVGGLGLKISILISIMQTFVMLRNASC